jgi:hypothetical protein
MTEKGFNTTFINYRVLVLYTIAFLLRRDHLQETRSWALHTRKVELLGVFFYLKYFWIFEIRTRFKNIRYDK